MNNYVNKSASASTNELKNLGANYKVIGNGNKVVGQYPTSGTFINANDKVFILTNNYEKAVPNLYGYSYREATSLLKLMNIKYDATGDGHLYEQSIPEGIVIGEEDRIDIKFKIKYESG